MLLRPPPPPQEIIDESRLNTEAEMAKQKKLATDAKVRTVGHALSAPTVCLTCCQLMLRLVV